MLKVVKKAEQRRIYQCECENCHSIVQGEADYDFKDERCMTAAYWSWKCPVCGEQNATDQNHSEFIGYSYVT